MMGTTRQEIASDRRNHSSPIKWKSFIGLTILACGGCIGLYYLTIEPVREAIQSYDWTPCNCKVVDGRVEELNSDQDSSASYRVFVEYTYIVDQEEYRADTLRLSDYWIRTTFNTWEGAKDFAALYPSGKEFSCYYHPSNPSKAIITPGVSMTTVWIALIPILPLIIGIVGLFKSITKAFARTDINTQKPVREFGPKILRSSRYRRALQWLGYSITWNGALLALLSLGYPYDGVNFSLMLVCMAPFIIISLMFILQHIRDLLSFAVPIPQVTITPGTAVYGEDFQVAWKIPRLIFPVASLRVLLIANEKTIDRSSGSSIPRYRALLKKELWCLKGEETGSGRKQVRLPGEEIDIAEGPERQVLWELRLIGQIKFWPDTEDRYEIPLVKVRGD
jgi:hypothetical protein